MHIITIIIINVMFVVYTKNNNKLSFNLTQNVGLGSFIRNLFLSDIFLIVHMRVIFLNKENLL